MGLIASKYTDFNNYTSDYKYWEDLIHTLHNYGAHCKILKCEQTGGTHWCLEVGKTKSSEIASFAKNFPPRQDTMPARASFFFGGGGGGLLPPP